MPWSNMLAVVAGEGGRGAFNVTYDTFKRTDLNLWLDLGSPGQPADIIVLVDGIDICTFELGDWAASTIVDMQLINGARILGRGGIGGDGGESVPIGGGGYANTPGGDGMRGLPAVLMNNPIEFNLDFDDGFIWGGGGGGGGGGAGDAQPGGGGGGGGGWNVANGGGSTAGGPGTAGGPLGPGVGGSPFTAGGDGGPIGQRSELGFSSTTAGGQQGEAGFAVEMDREAQFTIFSDTAIVTTISTGTLEVAMVGHNMIVGQRVYFLPLSAINNPPYNGINLDWSYEVTVVTDVDNFEVEDSQLATSSGSIGGIPNPVFVNSQDDSAIFTFSGAKDEETLVSEGRLLGPIGGHA